MKEIAERHGPVFTNKKKFSKTDVLTDVLP